MVLLVIISIDILFCLGMGSSGPKSNLDKDDDVVLVLNQKLLQLAREKVDASIYVGERYGVGL